jgi:hypothetical protein
MEALIATIAVLMVVGLLAFVARLVVYVIVVSPTAFAMIGICWYAAALGAPAWLAFALGLAAGGIALVATRLVLRALWSASRSVFSPAIGRSTPNYP